MLIGRLLYKKGMYAEARDSLMKAEHGFKSLYLGAIDVKQDKVDTGLKLMRSALESTEHYVEKVVAHREIAEILIDLGRKEEAKQHLEEGHAMAEKSGMKGEIKKYDDLMERLKEI